MSTDNLDKKKVAETENTKMFRSRFDIFVLNALADESCEGYGYDVVNYIQNKTKGHYKIKTFSTVYNTLKRLEEQNLVVSHKGGNESNGASRVYYSLTDEGREYLERDKVEYKYLRTLLDNLLTDEDFDLDREEIPYSASTLKPLTKRTKVASDLENTQVINYQPSEEVVIDVDSNVTSSEVIDNNGDNATQVLVTAIPEVVDNSNVKQTENIVRPAAIVKKIKEEPNNNYKVVMERITKPVFDAQKAAKREQKLKNAPIQSVNANVKVIKKEIPTVKSTVVQSKVVSPTVATVRDNDKTAKTLNVPKTKLEEYNSILRNEGYTLRTYTNTTASSTNNAQVNTASSSKYVFINKLLRDSVVLSALFCIITLLVLYLTRSVFEFSIPALITIGAISIAAALVFVVIWFQKPEKRKKDNLNIKALNAITVAIFLVVVMLDLIISLLIPNGHSLNSPQVYSPIIIATTVPFFGLVFTLLYKSGNYFKK